MDNLENKIGTQAILLKPLFKYSLPLITVPNFLDVSGIEKSARSIGFREAQRIKLLFFANAYHSWERGTNEVMLMDGFEDYFPKGTDFSVYLRKSDSKR
jgi:hypothetical protein